MNSTERETQRQAQVVKGIGEQLGVPTEGLAVAFDGRGIVAAITLTGASATRALMGPPDWAMRLKSALLVIVRDPALKAHLEQHDPKALEQAESALRGAW